MDQERRDEQFQPRNRNEGFKPYKKDHTMGNRRGSKFQNQNESMKVPANLDPNAPFYE
jgi:hypothetical protein